MQLTPSSIVVVRIDITFYKDPADMPDFYLDLSLIKFGTIIAKIKKAPGFSTQCFLLIGIKVIWFRTLRLSFRVQKYYPDLQAS